MFLPDPICGADLVPSAFASRLTLRPLAPAHKPNVLSDAPRERTDSIREASTATSHYRRSHEATTTKSARAAPPMSELAVTDHSRLIGPEATN